MSVGRYGTKTFEKTWTKASETLRTMVNPDLFNLWFDPIQPGTIDEETALLIVPNEFCAVWLKDNYLDLLQDVLAHITGKKLSVQFEVNESAKNGVPTQTPDTPAVRGQAGQAGGVRPIPYVFGKTVQP